MSEGISLIKKGRPSIFSNAVCRLTAAKTLLRRAARHLVIVISTPRFDSAVVNGNLARRGDFYCG